MKKYSILLPVCAITFFCTLCFADTSTILIDKKEVIVPNYEGFTLVSDRNSPEFKKIDASFTSSPNAVTYGYYLQNNPGTDLKIISLLGLVNAPEYLSKKEWTTAKNDIYQDSQKPQGVQEDENTKLVPTLTESITQPELYNTYIYNVKYYAKNNGAFTEVGSTLDTKTYVYLNGKIIIVMISMNDRNSYNEENIKWAKVISVATAEKLIELNPPTEADLKAEKQASNSAIKVILAIIAGLIYYIIKFFRRSKKESTQTAVKRTDKP
ncbi:MAG: hypothetical protein AB7I18_01870 [Candidatus Berkiella sp.]